MHTCPPPLDLLKKWLADYPTTIDGYGHLLLEQRINNSQSVADLLRPYFESAHFDARKHFHDLIGIDLHPDADDEGVSGQYPGCLPVTTLHGLFGEVMAGLIAESYDFIGSHKWSIPVFLFRYHADAEKYLFDLAREPEQTRAVFGRFGTDFLGLSLDEDGAVIRFIAGEAKWRRKLQRSVVDELLLGEWVEISKEQRVRSGKGIWYELNKDTPIPHGLRQLQRILKECDQETYSKAIISLDEALSMRTKQIIPRTNLILIAGNNVPSRKARTARISWKEIPSEYQAKHDLQVVELYMDDGELLIKSIYDSLWSGED